MTGASHILDTIHLVHAVAEAPQLPNQRPQQNLGLDIVAGDLAGSAAPDFASCTGIHSTWPPRRDCNFDKNIMDVCICLCHVYSNCAYRRAIALSHSLLVADTQPA